MEYDWERTFPFLKINKNIVTSLFEGILDVENIVNIIPINEGCRTTNYIIETNEQQKKYILKIFFSTEQNYKKEIKLLKRLREDGTIPVPKIYKICNDRVIENREYAIYEYMEGITIGQAISKGYELKEEFVREVAKYLAKIHSYKFSKAGFLDEDLNLKEELPPLALWYQKFMGINAQKRFGKDIVDKVNRIVKDNEKILFDLDKDIRLVHGDFQGTNILIKDNKLSGILDWEFAMAGHPLADIGQFFRYEEYFNKNLIQVFEDEYNKNSYCKLMDSWYKISKLRDLTNLIQLINANEDMPNKYANIKILVVNILKQF
ncbi:homoserine kinase [Clostridium puniceum]|uniref:Homoserine kinase n=1 Tax=Clostridium puniceum TaxID=29367 RepID=A0A1S8T4G3_9CLOT|nr:aminoglycoside phosphotransferase family protein [Clostridium puniceum]OOM72491.1 homoserine kinase [Clostridium puniceum]